MKIIDYIVNTIDERGLSYDETKELIKDTIKIDLRTKKGKNFLLKVKKAYENLYH